MKDNLHVSECFYSIQGEGQTMGIPAVFLRLSGCNLLCKSDNWVCDTIEVWRKGVKTPFKDVIKKEWVKRIQEGAHLVITGGEPLLHDKAVDNFLTWFRNEFNFIPIVEIETNGTFTPSINLLKKVSYWNCSPKLSTSGEPYKKRMNDHSLRIINKYNSIFKFVISCEEDILEVLQDFSPFIDMKKAVFMPSGDTQELLDKSRVLVANQCIKHGIRYSERLHVVIWNQKTGV